MRIFADSERDKTIRRHYNKQLDGDIINNWTIPCKTIRRPSLLAIINSIYEVCQCLNDI